ncbi:MAG: hypothetical protein LDL41_15240 [Coleofasciculus sp. S288]|nr:hypothetical protein [Coleofasciculus sp. S288]
MNASVKDNISWLGAIAPGDTKVQALVAYTGKVPRWRSLLKGVRGVSLS